MWLKLDTYHLQQKCTPKNLVFSNTWVTAIFVAVSEDEFVREMHPIESDNLITIA